MTYIAVFTDDTQGIYTVPVIEHAVITSIATSGNVKLNFNAPASYNYDRFRRLAPADERTL